MENTFSMRLKKIRQELGIAQKELAESVGISPMSISTYENGTKSPSIETAIKIARKYNVSLDWLCGLSQRRQSSIIPETMADILNILFEVEKVTPIQIFHNEELIDQNMNYKNDYPDFQPTNLNEIGFVSDLLNGYINEWNKMRTLYNEGTIDNEVYSLWKEKVLIQATSVYPNGERITSDFIIPDGE